MANMLAGLVDSAVKWSSAGTLRALWEHIGASATAAAADLPRLTAALDQHAAAVRDALSAGAGVIGSAALAGYTKGILEGAKSLAWHASHDVDWARAGWLELRLAAIGVLARQYGHLPHLALPAR
jgi:hypothetical protein